MSLRKGDVVELRVYGCKPEVGIVIKKFGMTFWEIMLQGDCDYRATEDDLVKTGLNIFDLMKWIEPDESEKIEKDDVGN